MKRFLLLFGICFAFSFSLFAQTAYTSANSGPWTTATTWTPNIAGGPSSTDGVITISAGHTVDMDVSTSVDQVVIQGTGNLRVNQGVTMTIADGSGTDLNINSGGTLTQRDDGFFTGSSLVVNGQVINAGTLTRLAGLSPITFNSVSSWEHAQDGGSLPGTNVTWNTGSSVLVTGVISSIPGNMNQNFNNFEWNCTSQSGTLDFGWTNRTMTGDVTITDTNAAATSGLVAFNLSGSGTIIINGDLTISSNSRIAVAGSGTVPVTCSNFSFNPGAVAASFFSSTGAGTLNVSDDFTFTSGTFSHGTSATINFNGGDDQNFTGGGSFTGAVNMNITNSSTLLLGTGSISTDGTFTIVTGSTLDTGTGFIGGASGSLVVNIGAKLRLGIAAGIEGTSSGAVRVPIVNRTYTAGSTITYNGSVAQNVGLQFPSTAVNLEIANSAGVTNNNIGVTSVLGDLILTSGSLVIGNTNTLDIKDDVVANGGFIRGGSSSNLTFSGSGNVTGTPGTINFESGFRELNDFTISRSEDVPLGTDLTMNGTLLFSASGDLILSSGVTLSTTGTGGDIDQAPSQQGAISSLAASPANLNIGGTNELSDLPICTSCGSMGFTSVTLSRTDDGGTASYTLDDAVTVTNFNLNSGVLTNNPGSLTMANGGTFSRGSAGSITTSAPSAAGTYNLTYTGGTVTAGLEFPTAASNVLANLTSAANLTFNKNAKVTGTLSLTSGTMDASAFNLEMAGTSWNVSGGSFTINPSQTVTFTSGSTTTINSASPLQFGKLTVNLGTTLALSDDEDISISGALDFSGGFTASNSIVTFNGTSPQTIDANSQSFNSVVFGGSGTKTLDGSLLATGSLTIESGVTLDAGASANTITVAGTWENNDTYVASGNTVIFNGSGQSIDNNNDPFYDLTISGSGTKTLSAPLEVDNNLLISGGTLAGSSNAISLGGNWTNNSTFTPGSNGSITFNGTTAISGSSTTTFRDVTISGDVTGPAAMNVSRNWVFSSGSYTPNSGTVTFNGAAQSITSGGNSFYNITLAGSNTKTLVGAADINGALTISGTSTLAAGSNNITLAGNWTKNSGTTFSSTGTVIFDGTTIVGGTGTTNFNNITIQGAVTGTAAMNVAGNWLYTSGSFTPGGLVTFNGSGAQSITSGAQSFNAVTISGSGTKTLLSSLDVNGNLTITTATLSAGTNNITISGNWASGSGTFTPGSGIVTLDGAAQNITLGSNTFNNLTVAGSSTKTMQDQLDINGSLTINSALSAGSDNDILIAGNWTNNGTFTSAAGKVTFDGNGTSNVDGTPVSSVFYDIDVTGSTTVEIESTHSLAGTLSLVGASSSFNADGSGGSGDFTLVSSDDSPASDGKIASLTTPGNFTGNVTVERYISTGDFWKYISSPVSGLTIADWQTEFPVSGDFTGTDNGNPGVAPNALPSLYYYDAGAEDWQQYPVNQPGDDNSGSIVPGVGYSAYIRDNTAPFTDNVVSQEGLVNKGNWDFTQAGQGDLQSTTSGWNLLGNPYPAPLDWNALYDDGSTAGVGGVMSIRDNSSGVFRGYDAQNNVAVNSGTKNIGVGQAFWVNSTSSPTLTATEAMKVTDETYSFYNLETPVNYLRIALVNGAARDETLIFAYDDASFGIDKYDSYKRANEIFNLSSLLDDGSDMVVNAINALNCDAEIALNITQADPGNYQLSFTEFESFVEDFDIMLKDNFTGTVISVKDDPNYAFEITADANSTGNGRFTVYFGSSQIDQTLEVTANTTSCLGEMVPVSISDSQTGLEYQAFINGDPVSEVVVGDGLTLILDASTIDLTEGDYSIEILAVKPGCSSIPLLQEAAVSLSAKPDPAIVVDSEGCIGQAITLTASGAPEGGSYNWYSSLESSEPMSGENSETLIIPNLTATTIYYVAAVNSLGCESSEKMAITAIASNTNEIELVTNTSVCSGAVAVVSATGAPVDGSYNWYLSPEDTDPIDGVTGSEYTFNELLSTTTIFVTVVNSSGCESNERVAVTAEAVPVYAVTNTINGGGCSDSSVEISATGAPENGYYKWYESATATEPIEGINTGTFITPALSVSRSYFVTAVNSQGCESLVREEVFASVEPVYLVDEVVGGTSCPGQAITLTASGAPENGSYRWYESSGTLIEGETGAVFSTSGLLETTDFLVSVVNSVGCESPLVTVTASISNEALTIEAEDSFICGPGEVTLSASGAPLDGSYQWYDSDGNPIENAVESSFKTSLSVSSVFSVQSISTSGCTSELLTVTTELREAVPQPEIIKETDLLRSSITGDGYQWYKDEEPIDGENGSLLSHGYDAGSYTLEVFRNECSSVSEPMVVLSVFDEFNSGELDLYPNPTKDLIQLEFNEVESAKVTIYLVDMSGKILHSEVLNNNAGRVDWEYSTREYDNGVYFVKLADGMKVLTGRFVKR